MPLSPLYPFFSLCKLDKSPSSLILNNVVRPLGFLLVIILIGAGAGLYLANKPPGAQEKTEETSGEAAAELSNNPEEFSSGEVSNLLSELPSSSKSDLQASSSKIVDGTLGIEFEVPDDLSRAISLTALYYFEVPDVAQINCSLLSKQVDAGLKNGEVIDSQIKSLLGELSGSYDDVSESSKRAFSLGDGVGIRVAINLGREGESLKRVDQFGVVPGRVIHMYCEAPPSLYKVFEQKFENMLSSLKISK